MHAAVKLIHGFTPNRPPIEEATAHFICLVEEFGEVYEEIDTGSDAMLYELADVIISANMMNLTLYGKPILEADVNPDLLIGTRLLALVGSIARVASIWRKLSGMRARASRTPVTHADLEKALSVVVGRAYAVFPDAPLRQVVLKKLDEILERGSGLSKKEQSIQANLSAGEEIYPASLVRKSIQS